MPPGKPDAPTDVSGDNDSARHTAAAPILSSRWMQVSVANPGVWFPGCDPKQAALPAKRLAWSQVRHPGKTDDGQWRIARHTDHRSRSTFRQDWKRARRPAGPAWPSHWTAASLPRRVLPPRFARLTRMTVIVIPSAAAASAAAATLNLGSRFIDRERPSA